MNVPVSGYYPNTFQWLSEIKQLQLLRPIYSSESIHLPYPQGKGMDHFLKWVPIVGHKKIPGQFVVNIPLGRFLGGKSVGAIITPTNKILADVSHEHFSFSNFVSKKPHEYAYIPNRIAVLQSYFNQNYFHFLFDVVARIHLLQKSGIPIHKYIVMCKEPFQDELFTLLGIPKERRIESNPFLHVKANQLIVPSFIVTPEGLVPKWACDFLRNELLVKRKVEKIQEYRRIYISRALANHRRIANEDEVMGVLGLYGFKRVFLEDESMERKIQILNSAEIVIAPHGAGLANLIFCDAGTKVIEILNPNWMFPSFLMISHYMNLNYYFLIGKEVPEPNKIKGVEDTLVDLNKLKETLSLASI